MKQPSVVEPASAPLPIGSVDSSTLELFAAWKAEDATSDPEKVLAADREVDEFIKALNENRSVAGERPLFP